MTPHHDHVHVRCRRASPVRLAAEKRTDLGARRANYARRRTAPISRHPYIRTTLHVCTCVHRAKSGNSHAHELCGVARKREAQQTKKLMTDGINLVKSFRNHPHIRYKLTYF